jgi:hypothetical protein
MSEKEIERACVAAVARSQGPDWDNCRDAYARRQDGPEGGPGEFTVSWGTPRGMYGMDYRGTPVQWDGTKAYLLGASVALATAPGRTPTCAACLNAPALSGTAYCARC